MPDPVALLSDPLATMAALFEPPDVTYLARVDAMIEVLRETHPVAARQLADFLGRLEGLSESELGELYAQTFDKAPGASPSALQSLGRLKFVERDVRPGYIIRVVSPAIERDLARLGEQRNPFVHLLKATLCVLLPATDDALGKTP